MMHRAVKEIIEQICTNEVKKQALDSLLEDVETAKGILSGKFKYCPKCRDYYLARSFIEDTETKECQVCVYKDPINSGGNEYKPGYLYTTYRTCPKGHKEVVKTEEREKRN